MSVKKRKKKQDPKLVSKQKHEIAYIAKKFGVRLALVKAVVSVVGISRRKVYKELRDMGHTIIKPVKKMKK